MKTAFEFAYDAYMLRKQAEHQVNLKRLQREIARLPDTPSIRPTYSSAVSTLT